MRALNPLEYALQVTFLSTKFMREGENFIELKAQLGLNVYICMCMYVYIHTSIHTYIYISCIHTHTHTHTHTHSHTHTHTQVAAPDERPVIKEDCLVAIGRNSQKSVSEFL